MVKIKRASIIACLAALFVMLMGVVSFGADDFSIVKTLPADGAKNTTKDNMCVKVYFSTEVGNEESRKANEDKVTIKDEDGKEFPTLIYYSDDDPKYALIVVDTSQITSKKDLVQDNTEYTLTISKDFVDNNGTALGDDANRKVTFKTINQKRNTLVYMLLMAAMMIGMVVFSVRQARNNAVKEDEAAGISPIDTFNPYKEAKRTGKSLKEVIEEHEKEVAKREAKEAKKRRKAGGTDDDPFRDGDFYRVKKPRPISAAGSTFKTGRKAIAEAEAAKKAAEKAARKAANYAKVKTKPVNKASNKHKKK